MAQAGIGSTMPGAGGIAAAAAAEGVAVGEAAAAHRCARMTAVGAVGKTTAAATGTAAAAAARRGAGMIAVGTTARALAAAVGAGKPVLTKAATLEATGRGGKPPLTKARRGAACRCPPSGRSGGQLMRQTSRQDGTAASHGSLGPVCQNQTCVCTDMA